MITKVSVIGTMKNGKIKKVSVSAWGRKLEYKDSQKMFYLGKVHFQSNIEKFKEIKVCLEIRKWWWVKPYKVTRVINDLPHASVYGELQDIFNRLLYEMEAGKFKDCKF